MRSHFITLISVVLFVSQISLSGCDDAEPLSEIDREWTSVKPEIKHPGENVQLGEGLIEISARVRRRASIESRVVGVDGFILILNDGIKFPETETDHHETFEAFLQSISETSELNFSWIGDVIVISNMELKLYKYRESAPRSPSNHPILPWFQFAGGALSEMIGSLVQEINSVNPQSDEIGRERLIAEKSLVSPLVWSFLFDMKEPSVLNLVNELITLNSEITHTQ